MSRIRELLGLTSTPVGHPKDPKPNVGPVAATGGRTPDFEVPSFTREVERPGEDRDVRVERLTARLTQAQDLVVAYTNDRDALRAQLAGLMTDEEQSILHDLGQIAGRMVAALGDDDLDVNEMLIPVHVLQSRVLQQAAARAYPDKVRLLLPRRRNGDQNDGPAQP
jgi:hypothetical protein